MSIKIETEEFVVAYLKLKKAGDEEITGSIKKLLVTAYDVVRERLELDRNEMRAQYQVRMLEQKKRELEYLLKHPEQIKPAVKEKPKEEKPAQYKSIPTSKIKRDDDGNQPDIPGNGTGNP